MVTHYGFIDRKAQHLYTVCVWECFMKNRAVSLENHQDKTLMNCRFNTCRDQFQWTDTCTQISVKCIGSVKSSLVSPPPQFQADTSQDQSTKWGNLSILEMGPFLKTDYSTTKKVIEYVFLKEVVEFPGSNCLELKQFSKFEFRFLLI